MTMALTVTTLADRVHAPPARVLLVGPLPPPSGGMANQTRQLARLLEGEGCAVVLAQTNSAYRPAWIALTVQWSDGGGPCRSIVADL